jgi:hypothetical protein
MFCLTLLMLTPFIMVMTYLGIVEDCSRPAPRAICYHIHPDRPPVQLVKQPSATSHGVNVSQER